MTDLLDIFSTLKVPGTGKALVPEELHKFTSEAFVSDYKLHMSEAKLDKKQELPKQT